MYCTTYTPMLEAYDEGRAFCALPDSLAVHNFLDGYEEELIDGPDDDDGPEESPVHGGWSMFQYSPSVPQYREWFYDGECLSGLSDDY